jgi:hypothetical protein
MESDTGTGRPEVAGPDTRPAEQMAELFDALARRADEVAEAAEHSADVHERLPPHVLSPPDHLERDRMLAAAERAAAEAYRAHRVPSDEVRAAIVRAGHVDTDGAAHGPSGPRRSSPDT